MPHLPCPRRIYLLYTCFSLSKRILGVPQLLTTPGDTTPSASGNSAETTRFPIIYVNGGILSCGAVTGLPYLTSLEALTPWYTLEFDATVTVSNHWTTSPSPGDIVIESYVYTAAYIQTFFYIQSTFPTIVTRASYSPGIPTATVLSTLSFPFTYTTIGKSYFPYDTGGDTPTGAVTTQIISEAPDRKRSFQSFHVSHQPELAAVLPLHSIEYSNSSGQSPLLQRDIIEETDCQWSSLYGISTPAVTSNSLEDVCNIVQSVPYCFVTLQPTAAAHMPTWCAYVIQVLLLVGSFISLVDPPCFSS